MATVYPDFARDGFYLENAVCRAELFPNFRIAHESQRYAIQPGQLVKMDFTFALEGSEKDGTETERMWVLAKARIDDHWLGILDNDPAFHDVITSGHEFHFHPDHIVALREAT